MLVQQLDLSIISVSHILYLFLLYLKKVRVREILVDRTGKKDWSKGMFELTRAPNIRGFLRDSISEDSRGMQKQLDSLDVRVIGESSDLECNIINFLTQCAFNTNVIFPQ